MLKSVTRHTALPDWTARASLLANMDGARFLGCFRVRRTLFLVLSCSRAPLASLLRDPRYGQRLLLSTQTWRCAISAGVAVVDSLLGCPPPSFQGTACQSTLQAAADGAPASSSHVSAAAGVWWAAVATEPATGACDNAPAHACRVPEVAVGCAATAVASVAPSGFTGTLSLRDVPRRWVRRQRR